MSAPVEVTMKERCVQERNEARYIHGYWVGGLRLRMPDGRCGWHVISWADSGPITSYWIADGKFHEGSTSWVDSSTFDVAIGSQVVEVEPGRKRILLDAIDEWDAQDAPVFSGGAAGLFMRAI
jgi:hypothetical protein